MRHELLWTEDAQRAMTNRLELWYMFLAMLLTVALFVVAIAVWHSLPHRAPRRSRAADGVCAVVSAALYAQNGFAPFQPTPGAPA